MEFRPSFPVFRFLAFLGLLLLFGFTFWFAFRQTPRTNPYNLPSFSQLEWWLNPIETNPSRRLPRLFLPLESVAMDPISGEIWAVSENTVVLRSTDRGKTWERWLPVTGSYEADESDLANGGDKARPGPKVNSTITLVPAKEAGLFFQIEVRWESIHWEEGFFYFWGIATSSQSSVSLIFDQQDHTQRTKKYTGDKQPHQHKVRPGDKPQTGSTLMDLELTFPPQFLDTEIAFHLGPHTQLQLIQDNGYSGLLVAERNQTEWQAITALPNLETVLDTFFIGRDFAFRVKADSSFETSQDHGRTWSKRPLPPGIQGEKVVMESESLGALLTRDQQIFFTKDGGITWFQIPTDAVFPGVSAASEADYEVLLDWYNRRSGINKAKLRRLLFETGGPYSYTVGNQIIRWVESTSPDARPPKNAFGEYIVDRSSEGQGYWYWSSSDGTVHRNLEEPEEATTLFLESGEDIPRAPVTGEVNFIAGKENAILLFCQDGKVWRYELGSKSWTFGQPLGETPIHQFVASTGGGISDRIVGAYGSIAESYDNGKTWQPIDFYRKYPAPWWYVSLAFFALAGYRLLRPEVKTQTWREGMASGGNYYQNDTAVEEVDQDRLNFTPIAHGIARYIRNANTHPPLTLAVTGSWGSGKSSLMNLIRKNLKSYGFLPVQFNCWHYQNEKNLLASLLENIRCHALPPIYSVKGIIFRWKLLLVRSKRNKFYLFAFFAILAVWAGYLYADPDRAGEIIAKTKLLGSQVWNMVTGGNVEEKLRNAAKTESPFPVEIFFLASLVTVFGLLGKAMQAFGLKPVSLLTSISGRFSMRNMQKEVGFRAQFASDFEEVTKSLAPTHLVLFIDDLDRCRPDNIMSILEAINFLCSCGEIFLIIGMDREKVEKSVGWSLRQMASDLAPTPGNTQETVKEKRKRVAKDYLEKLIHLEIPVPAFKPEQTHKFLAGQEPGRLESTAGAPMKKSFRDRLDQLITAEPSSSLKALFFTTLFILITASSAYISTPEAPERIIGLENQVISETSSQVNDQQTTTPQQATEDLGPANRHAKFTATGLVHKKVKDHNPIFWALILLLGFLIAGIVRLIMTPTPIVHDSPQFVEAVKRWQPILMARKKTPRSFKFFVNQCRFYTMFEESLLDDERAGTKKPRAVIPTESLVSMAAVRYCFPDLWQALVTREVSLLYVVDKIVEEAPDFDAETFKEVFSSEHLQHFMRIAGGVRGKSPA